MRFEYPSLSFQNPPASHTLFTNLLTSVIMIHVFVIPLIFRIFDFCDVESKPVDETLFVYFVLVVQHLPGISWVRNTKKTFFYGISPHESI